MDYIHKKIFIGNREVVIHEEITNGNFRGVYFDGLNYIIDDFILEDDVFRFENNGSSGRHLKEGECFCCIQILKQK